MSRTQHVGQVLQELAAEAGLASLSLDASDRASLLFDDIPVTFAYTAEPMELLWIWVDLGEIPADGAAAPECLLRLGLMSWAASVMTIGLDEQGRRALGFTSIAVAMLDLARLKEVLARLLAAARPIRERLAAGRFELDRDLAGATGPGGRSAGPDLRA
jgi:Tir chaperone protein (CesT) family